MAEFLDMGGYAAFVWSAYGVALLVILFLVGQSLHDCRTQTHLVERLERAAGGRVRRAAYKPDEEGTS